MNEATGSFGSRDWFTANFPLSRHVTHAFFMSKLAMYEGEVLARHKKGVVARIE